MFELRVLSTYKKYPQTASRQTPPKKAPMTTPAIAPAENDGFGLFGMLAVVEVQAIVEVEVSKVTLVIFVEFLI